VEGRGGKGGGGSYCSLISRKGRSQLYVGQEKAAIFIIIILSAPAAAAPGKLDLLSRIDGLAFFYGARTQIQSFLVFVFVFVSIIVLVLIALMPSFLHPSLFLLQADLFSSRAIARTHQYCPTFLHGGEAAFGPCAILLLLFLFLLLLALLLLDLFLLLDLLLLLVRLDLLLNIRLDVLLGPLFDL